MGVSKGTVRRALVQLETERLVVRQQRRGTFVTDQAFWEFATRFNNVRDKDGNPIPIDGLVLQQTRAVANTQEQSRLAISLEAPVLRTRRLYTKGSHRYLYEEAVINLRFFPQITSTAIGNYSLSLLAQQHGLRLESATERVSAVNPSSHVAELLGLEVGVAVVQLDRLVTVGYGRPVEWRVAYCHLEDSQYVVSMC